jgi:hypothetical protein
MSSTVAFRAALVREIEQSMKRIDQFPGGFEDGEKEFQDGQLDAYAHILSLVSDMEDQ